MDIKRGALILAVILFLAATGWLLFNYNNRLANAENQLEAQYQMAFFNLLEHSENLDMLLSKSLVSSSPRQNIINLTTIWHEAENARIAIDRLPIGLKLQSSQKYLAQLGDFAFFLAKKNASEQAMDKEEWEKLKELKEHTQNLNSKLHALIPQVKSGKIKWGSLDDEASKNKARPGVENIGTKLGEIDQRLKEEAPTLTYDGPFSEHVENIQPRGLEGSKITDEKARQIARDFVDVAQDTRFNIKEMDNPKGSIDAYAYTLDADNSDDDIVIDVSKKGGHVIWYLNQRDVNSAEIEIQDAIQKAESFLKQRGFKNMIKTGSLRQDNILTVTFVPKINDVVIYPDFIKVSVAMDNKQVVGYDAQGYLTAHTDRQLPEPELSEDEVREIIKSALDIKRVRLALIPSPGRKELLCYEVRAQLEEDEEYYIYINALNGQEEQILKIIETEDGTFTM